MYWFSATTPHRPDGVSRIGAVRYHSIDDKLWAVVTRRLSGAAAANARRDLWGHAATLLGDALWLFEQHGVVVPRGLDDLVLELHDGPQQVRPEAVAVHIDGAASFAARWVTRRTLVTFMLTAGGHEEVVALTPIGCPDFDIEAEKR